MKKTLPLLALGVLIAGVAFTLLQTSEPDPARNLEITQRVLDGGLAADGGAGAEPPAPVEDALPAPRVITGDAEVLPPDAAWLEQDDTMARVHRSGLMGRDERWIDEIFNRPHSGWSKVKDDRGPAWREDQGRVTAIFILNSQRRVVQLRAEFSDEALSADVPSLGSFLFGYPEHLPFHLEFSERMLEPIGGDDFTVAGTRRIRWRAQMRTEGEPPYGPKWLEIEELPMP